MSEIQPAEYRSSFKRKTKIKMSNMDMNIIININNKLPPEKGRVLNYKDINSATIPSFTKRIFKVALK